MLCHHEWPLSDRPVPEVGWVLHRDFWGEGWRPRVERPQVKVWQEHLPDEPRLYSFTSPGNARSRAVMERLGFTLRGRLDYRGWETVWYTLDRA